MAGQAGWYHAPGEEGLLRYWNGRAWTEHRQPAPAAVSVTGPEAEAAPEPTPFDEIGNDFSVGSVQPSTAPDWSMDQFERQFESQFTDAPLASPEPPLVVPGDQAPQLDAQQDPFVDFASVLSASDATTDDQQASDAQVSRFAPQPVSAALRFAPPPVLPERPLAPSVPSAADLAAMLDVPAAAATEQKVAQSRQRRVLVGAVRGMLAGLAIILIGAALVFFLGQQSAAAVGQTQTLGIITALGSTGGSCSPTARFAAGSDSYTAGTGAAVSPCQFQLGQSVSVVYSPANPKASGRIVVPDLLQVYSWAAPVLGIVVLVLSVLVFVFGAGSLAAGIAIMRDGRQDAPRRRSSGGRRRRSAAPESAG